MQRAFPETTASRMKCSPRWARAQTFAALRCGATSKRFMPGVAKHGHFVPRQRRAHRPDRRVAQAPDAQRWRRAARRVEIIRQGRMRRWHRSAISPAMREGRRSIRAAVGDAISGVSSTDRAAKTFNWWDQHRQPAIPQGQRRTAILGASMTRRNDSSTTRTGSPTNRIDRARSIIPHLDGFRGRASRAETVGCGRRYSETTRPSPQQSSTERCSTANRPGIQRRRTAQQSTA